MLAELFLLVQLNCRQRSTVAWLLARVRVKSLSLRPNQTEGGGILLKEHKRMSPPNPPQGAHPFWGRSFAQFKQHRITRTRFTVHCPLSLQIGLELSNIFVLGNSPFWWSSQSQVQHKRIFGFRAAEIDQFMVVKQETLQEGWFRRVPLKPAILEVMGLHGPACFSRFLLLPST